METIGGQSRRKDESLKSYMRRLYYKPANRGLNAIRSPNTCLKDVRWNFRPPTSLTAIAYKFMREHDMSVTTYLTYAMHNLHNKRNA